MKKSWIVWKEVGRLMVHPELVWGERSFLNEEAFLIQKLPATARDCLECANIWRVQSRGTCPKNNGVEGENVSLRSLATGVILGFIRSNGEWEREKFQEEISEIETVFPTHVSDLRPQTFPSNSSHTFALFKHSSRGKILTFIPDRNFSVFTFSCSYYVFISFSFSFISNILSLD
jgi:hypothetical protein